MKEIDYSSFFRGYSYINKTIPQEKWLRADMTEHMKETFEEYYLGSRILFSIPLKDTELLVIEVHVRKITRRQTDFSDLIHRSMPYPILLLESLDDEWFKISIAATHENSYNSFREVVDHHFASRWVQYPHFVQILYNIEKNMRPNQGKASFLNTTEQQLLEFNQHTKSLDYGSVDYEQLIDYYNERHDFSGSFITRLKQIIAMYETVDFVDYPSSDYYSFLENLISILEHLEYEIYGRYRADIEAGDEGDRDNDNLKILYVSSDPRENYQLLIIEADAIAQELNTLLLIMENDAFLPVTERIQEINALLASLIEEMQSLGFPETFL